MVDIHLEHQTMVLGATLVASRSCPKQSARRLVRVNKISSRSCPKQLARRPVWVSRQQSTNDAILIYWRSTT